MRRALFAIAVLLGSSGCLVVTYGRYSKATIPDAGAQPRTEGSVTWLGERDGDTFQLRDAYVQLIPLNESAVVSVWGLVIVPFLPLPGWDNDSVDYSEDVAHAPSFLFSLRVRSRGALSLKPAEVTLQRPDGSVAHPRGFWGLGAYSHCRDYVRKPTVADPQPFPTEPLAIRAGEDACITWLFDGEPPAPGERFSLELSGVHDANGPWLREPIRFEPASSWSWEWVLLF